jgi:NAD(P)-dependent dehydrogenase (short-subunit alcohol dehydrogenase family)
MDTRVALITGASSGIGYACATHLAAGGLCVYGTSRSAVTRPGSVTMQQMDVTDDQSVQRAVDTVISVRAAWTLS